MVIYDHLYERIMVIYSDLPQSEFFRNIKLRNDGDGDYIEKWDCQTYTEPTEEQLRSAI